jgi:hypothetical protein
MENLTFSTYPGGIQLTWAFEVYQGGRTFFTDPLYGTCGCGDQYWSAPSLSPFNVARTYPDALAVIVTLTGANTIGTSIGSNSRFESFGAMVTAWE